MGRLRSTLVGGLIWLVVPIGAACADGGWYYDWKCSSSSCASLMGGWSGTKGPATSRSECEGALRSMSVQWSCYQKSAGSSYSSVGSASSPGAVIGAMLGNAIVEGFRQAEENARIEAAIRAREQAQRAAEAEAARQRALRVAADAEYLKNQQLRATLQQRPGAVTEAGAMTYRDASSMFGPKRLEELRAAYCAAKLRSDSYTSAMRSLNFANSSELYDTYHSVSVEQRAEAINILLDNALGLSVDRFEAVSQLTPETVGAAIAKLQGYGFNDPLVFDKMQTLASARGKTGQMSQAYGEFVDGVNRARADYSIKDSDISTRTGKLEVLSAVLGVAQNNPTLGVGISGFQLATNAGFAYTLERGIKDADVRLDADLARQRELKGKIEESLKEANAARTSWRGVGGAGEPECPGAGPALQPIAATRPAQTAPAAAVAPSPAASRASPLGSAIGNPAIEAQLRDRYGADPQFLQADDDVVVARHALDAANARVSDLEKIRSDPSAPVNERSAAANELRREGGAWQQQQAASSAARVAEIKRDDVAGEAQGRLDAGLSSNVAAPGFAVGDFDNLRDAVAEAPRGSGAAGQTGVNLGGNPSSAAADLQPRLADVGTTATTALGRLEEIGPNGRLSVREGFGERNDGARTSGVIPKPDTPASRPVSASVLTPDQAALFGSNDSYLTAESNYSAARTASEDAARQAKTLMAEASSMPAGAAKDARFGEYLMADKVSQEAKRAELKAFSERKSVIEDLSKPLARAKPKPLVVDVPLPSQ